MDLHQLDLNKLHTFYAVAEQGGVSAAARTLALTPSAVSQSLAALEERLDVDLFLRVGRRLVLTPEGERLFRRFGEVRGSLRKLLDEVANEERAVRGLLRVGLFLGFPHERFADLLSSFIGEHDEVQLQLHYGSRSELRERLLAGRLDLAFSFDPEVDPAGRIEATRLFEQELILVAPRRLLPASPDLATLRRSPIIDYYRSDPLILRWIDFHYGRASGRARRPSARDLGLQVRVWAATTNLVLDLALRGVGAAVVPRHVAAPHLGRGGRLRAIEPGRRVLRDSLWLKQLRAGRQRPAHEAFREAARLSFPDRG